MSFIYNSSMNRLLAVILLFVACAWFPAEIARAIGSNNYQIKEDVIGGGSGRGSSNGYRSEDSTGGTTSGAAAATSYQSQAGLPSTNDPTLTFAVNSGSVNLGSLSTSTTKTGTASFTVSNYTSYGYVVQITGSPPSNGVHTLTAMSTLGGSSTGSEQFGINLKANTSPISFGADPLQVPSGFGFGVAASGYDTANQYKYVAGNTIASAPKSSGQTAYTISYIANMALSTPGGSYSGQQTIICIGTY